MTTSPSDVAIRYLRGLAAHSWDDVAVCLAAGVLRRGPYGDDYKGAAEYLEFLKNTMPTLPGYRMDIDRVTGISEHRVMVELRETIEIESGPLVTYEVLTFDLDGEGLLEEICIYIRQAPRT
ncbi:MAG TPA: nuclear transport factor 2 family protein [Acidimicrobiales bacterium]|jgi:hypothetical protein